MNNFQIVVKAGEELKNKGGSTIIDIRTVINDKPHPSEEWSDFGFIIIGWWINNYVKLIKSKDQTYFNNFMDGPYGFSTTIENNNIILAGYERSANQDITLVTDKTSISISDYREILLEASNALFDIAKNFQIEEDKDIAYLRKLQVEL